MRRADSRAHVLEQIRNPLIFFALALLVIEGIMGYVIGRARLTEEQTFSCICIMAGLFLSVIAVVTLITVKWPRHLYEDIAKELDASRALRAFVESAAFRDTIEDIISEHLTNVGSNAHTPPKEGM